MGLMVDPTKDAGGDFVSAGRKLALAVGISRWKANNDRQTPMLTMGFVVLQDANNGADNGKVFMEKFAMTQAAIFRIAGWAQAQGWVEPFDAENDEHIQKIMARGPVVAHLVDETYKDVTRAVVDSFDRYTGDHSPAWDAMGTAGEQEWNRIQSAMASKRDGADIEANDGHPNAPGNTGGPPGMPF